jgi:hypothetical protein
MARHGARTGATRQRRLRPDRGGALPQPGDRPRRRRHPACGWVNDFTEQNPGHRRDPRGRPRRVINQRIATYIQAGAPLDVIHADGGSAAMLAAQGLLEPLDDVVEALGGRDAFLPGRLLIFEDKVYSINQAARRRCSTTGPTCSRRPASSRRPPGTSCCTRRRRCIRRRGRRHRLARRREPRDHIYSGLFLWQNCGDYFDRDLNVDARQRAHPRGAAVLRRPAPVLATGRRSWAFTEPIESFWSGRAAMVFYWHGLDLTFRVNPGLAREHRQRRADARGPHEGDRAGRPLHLAVRQLANVEASKQWIQYIFTPENAQKLSEVQPMLYPPATYEAASTSCGRPRRRTSRPTATCSSRSPTRRPSSPTTRSSTAADRPRHLRDRRDRQPQPARERGLEQQPLRPRGAAGRVRQRVRRRRRGRAAAQPRAAGRGRSPGARELS